MSAFTKVTVESAPRTELHDVLGLTGAEVSVNKLPAGASVPFVHAHKENEELYFVLEGSGRIELDGDSLDLRKGDALRVAPATKRQIFAGDQGIEYICVQVKENSLGQYTAADAVIF